jgi:hypothetical protein
LVLSVGPPHYLGRAEKAYNFVLERPMPLLEVHHVARIRYNNVLLTRIRQLCKEVWTVGTLLHSVHSHSPDQSIGLSDCLVVPEER